MTEATLKKTTWSVRGMTCAACEGRVCRIMQTDPAIADIQVSVLQGRVTFSVKDAQHWNTDRQERLCQQLADAGYSVVRNAQKIARGSRANQREFQVYRRQFLWTLLWAIPLLTLSMGVMIGVEFSFLAPKLRLCIEAILSFAILCVNRKTIQKGLSECIARDFTMAALLTTGSLIAWFYSFVALFFLLDNPTYHTHLYFETAGMIFLFSSIGKMLESRAKVASNAALDSLIELTPTTACRIIDQKEESISSQDLTIGDIVRIRAGRRIPVDGLILHGQGRLDRSLLTGESVPVAVQENEHVQAGTLLQQGILDVKVRALGDNTELGQMIRLVERACASKAPLERIADQISRYFVPIVFSLATLTWFVQWIRTDSWQEALSYAIAVIVISCPCALGLATPTAITVGCSVAARLGILWKNARSVENFHHTQNFFFDKTGTLTQGRPRVLTWIHHQEASWHADLRALCTIRSLSEHPLAKAILRFVKDQGWLTDLPQVTRYRAIEGIGVEGFVDHIHYRIGNARTLTDRLDPSWRTHYEKAMQSGQTVLFVWKITGRKQRLIALIGIADAVRPMACQVVHYLRSQNRQVYMLTGDSQEVAVHIGRRLGLTESNLFAGLYPKQKTRIIQKHQSQGKTVAMIGDGLNDAPALTQANLGIAMGEGTQVAFRAADVVLMDSKIERLADALGLSNAVVRNIYQNLGWAVGYNALMIPFAAGLFEPWGYTIEPMWAAAAMSLSSVCVVSNALRLYRFRPISKDWTDAQTQESQNVTQDQLPLTSMYYSKRNEAMEKTIMIEGMMCKHCVRSVDKALRAIDGVADVLVSLEKKMAVVILDKEVSDDVLRQAIQEEEFEVTEIR